MEEGPPSTISFEKIMSQCYNDITQDELDLMLRAAPELIQKLRDTGQITEDDYDQHNIPKLPDEDYEVRHDYVLHRQRCVVITHEETVARFKYYSQKKADAKDPVFMRDMALIKKAQLAKVKKDAKEAEIVRKNSLTPLELQQEQMDIKMARAAKAQAKRLKDQKGIEDLELAYERQGEKLTMYGLYMGRGRNSDNDMDVDD